MNRTQRGLTLIELMWALMLAALLAYGGVAGLKPLLHKQRLTVAAEALAQGLRAAKVEAIQRNGRVILQPLGEDWANGWRMVADHTGQGAGDPRNPTLRVQPGSGVRIVPTPNAAPQVAFDYLGRPVLPRGGSLAASLHLCNDVRPDEYLRVVIARTGRVRISRRAPLSNLCEPTSSPTPPA